MAEIGRKAIDGYGNLIILYAEETGTNVAANTSTVHAWLSLHIVGSFSSSNIRVGVSGAAEQNLGYRSWGVGDYTIIEGYYSVAHDGAGNGTAGVSGYFNSYMGNWSISGNLGLSKIPRYTSITKFEVVKDTETSLKINWAAADYCDYGWYSIDNGATWTGGLSYPTQTVSGLKANTNYNVKIRVRRSDSQLTTDSNTVSQTTYDYPYCTVHPNFTIGNRVTMTLYNPLKRNVELFINVNGTEKSAGTTTGTTIAGFNSNEWIAWWYARIPNATSGKYKTRVKYGSISNKTSTATPTFSANTNNIKPTFTTFAYKDSNSLTSGVTGNDQVLVKGLSTLQVTIPNANKATAKQSATIKTYSTTIDTRNIITNYSSSADVVVNVGTLSTAGTKVLSVKALDSRNLSTTVSKNVVTYDYDKPILSVTATRLNNFEAQTTIKISGSYSRLVINNEAKNSFQTLQYRYKESSTSTWGEWQVLTPTIDTDTGKFSNADIILTLDNEKEFNFQFQAIDKLQTTTVEKLVSVGKPIFMISSNKMGTYTYGDANFNKNVKIPKNGTKGYGITNSDGVSIIRDWNNKCVTVDATGEVLYLGFQDTTSLNFLNGKTTEDSSGNITTAGAIKVGANGGIYVNGTKVIWWA